MQRGLLAAGTLMEVGWLMVGAASPRLTESAGFSQAMFDQLPPIWGWADVLRRTQTPESLSKVILVAGMAVAGLGFIAALLTARQIRRRWIAAGVGVFGVTLILTPGLLSTDLVMYAVYGRMAAVNGLNPYLTAPVSIAGDPLLEWASRTPAFATYGTPYGPAWTAFSTALAGLTMHASPLAQTVVYRFVGLSAHAANVYLIWRLASEANRNLAALLYAWNPLVLYEIVASGHNDGLMLTLMLAGLLIAFRTSALFGASAIWVGALVKWIPVVALPYVACHALKSRHGWRVRALWLVGSAVALAALTIVLSGPWLDPRDLAALRANTTAGGERYVNALLDLPTVWIATHVIDRAGIDLDAAQAIVRGWSFGAARLLFIGYVAFETIRLWRGRSDARQILEASVRTLLVALLVVASQVLAWYFTWPVAVAAPLGVRNRLGQLAVAYSVMYLPIFYAIHEDMLPTLVIPPLLASFVFVPVLCVTFWSRSRSMRVRIEAPGGVAA